MKRLKNILILAFIVLAASLSVIDYVRQETAEPGPLYIYEQRGISDQEIKTEPVDTAGFADPEDTAESAGPKDTAESVGPEDTEINADSPQNVSGSFGEQVSGNISESFGNEEFDDITHSTAEYSGRININTADELQLQQLSGIGPAKARSIIEYRNAYGGFLSTEELLEVKGIGAKTFEKIKDSVTVH